IGPPLADLFSASRIGRGKVTRPVGRLGADERALYGGSFELQLDTPKAASSPSEITVHATRNGVQNLNLFTSFLSDITDFKTYFLPNLNESSITGASPCVPTSSTEDNSGASEVVKILSTAPDVSPSFPVGRKITRPQRRRSPFSVPLDKPCHLNSYASIEFTLVEPSDTFRYSGKDFANELLNSSTFCGRVCKSPASVPELGYQRTTKFSCVKSGGMRRSTFTKLVAPATPAFGSAAHVFG